MKTFATLLVTLLLCNILLAQEKKAEIKLADLAKDKDGAYVLFNGKDLTGWDGNPALWSVEDGAIHGKTLAEPKLTSNTFLIFTGDVPANYELRVKWKMENGNSGVQVRSKRFPEGKDGNKWIVGGYQADIADNQYLGILYEERGKRGIMAQVGEKATFPADGGKKVVEKLGDPKEIKAGVDYKQWNETVITLKGNTITQTLNGKVTVVVVDEDEKNKAADGIIALQIHVGPPMKIWFKDITLKALE